MIMKIFKDGEKYKENPIPSKTYEKEWRITLHFKDGQLERIATEHDSMMYFKDIEYITIRGKAE